jgi:hypothetical protein
LTEHDELCYDLSSEGKRRLEALDAIRKEGRKVTICIACACGTPTGETGIILCTDWLLSGVLGSAETGHKQAWINGSFFGLTSGDPSEARVICGLLQAKFREAATIDETNIVSLIKHALYRRHSELRDSLAQRQFGMSHDDVIKFGKERLPSEYFRRYLDRAKGVELGSELIVAGFDADGTHQIVRTDRSCEAVLNDHFDCVGEGEYLARASLLHRGVEYTMPIDKAVYCVYEAKRAAERVKSVGKATLIHILFNKGKLFYIDPNNIHELEALYDKYGPKRIPNDLKLPDGLIEIPRVLSEKAT